MMQRPEILLIEDDANLSTILKEFLEVKGFSVVPAGNGEEGLKLFREKNFDLCLLDVMMPKMDGFTVAKKIRAQNDSIPFIFLTAKVMLEDRLQGLKLGADDYVTKPFSMEELILRINAILKRTQKIGDQSNSSYSLGSYLFDYESRILKFKDEEHKLTSKEAELLRILCIHKNQILERSVALNNIWSADNYFTSRSMDVYITKLRNYLKNDASVEIVNVHGTGYKLIVK
jgi:two-component system, OmpR family, response regulator